MTYVFDAKLGNMKKPARFVVYPRKTGDATVLVQSDRRIAQITLADGKGIISDGKGGHPGFEKLSAFFGGTDFQCPPDLLKKLNSIPEGDGTVSLTAKTVVL